MSTPSPSPSPSPSPTKEVVDLGGSRRRGSAPKAGSVWESRMKSDEVKGGIKVFNATPQITAGAGKRKTWKSEFTNNLDDGIPFKSNLDGNFKNKKVLHESGSDQDKPITTQINNLDQSDEDDDFVKIEIQNNNLETTVQDQDHKPNKTVIEDTSPILNKHPTPAPKSNPISHAFPRTNSNLQSFVDLVMWRDVSKSAFVFGIGTFAIISSSFTKDLNISFISLVSYLGLVYLAAIFLFRSLIRREINSESQDYVVGEEEAIWVVKLLLPYVNEFLVKLRALFSGDPATTMKLAVLLFILARCGSSITIWKMAKLGFMGVFTVPKVCSTYSSQLTAYGKFWIRRFEDAWKSCTHKKAVGFAFFTMIWNFSSVVARIWAVFMLFVAFKYYQQSSIKEGWVEEASVGVSASGRRFIQTDMRKQKNVH